MIKRSSKIKTKIIETNLIVYKKTDEWHIKWQRVTANGTTSENERQRVRTRDNEWQPITTIGYFG